MRKKLFDRKNFGNSWGFSKLCASFLLVFSLVLPTFSANSLLIQTPYSGALYNPVDATELDFSYYTYVYDYKNYPKRTYYKELFQADYLGNITNIDFAIIDGNEPNAVKVNYFNGKTFWLKYAIDESTVVTVDAHNVASDHELVEMLF